MPRYLVAYRRGARAAPGGFQPRGSNDNVIGPVKAPRRARVELGPRAPVPLQRANLGVGVLLAGPLALWNAADIYQGLVARARPFTYKWDLCNWCVHGFPLTHYATGGCAWGCSPNYQSINTDAFSDGFTTTARQTMYVGQGRLNFGVEQIRIEQIWTRKAGQPAAPAALILPRPDLGFTEAAPGWVLDPFTDPAVEPWGEPAPRRAPRPRPGEEPSQPLPRPYGPPEPVPIDIPPEWGPVVQPAPDLAPEAVPRAWQYDIQPDGQVDASPIPTPRVPKKPNKRVKERKMTVRSVAGVAWVAANAAWGAVEFVQNANGTLPEGVRLPGNALIQDMAVNVYENFDQVDWEKALEALVNDEIEDRFIGSTTGKRGKQLNQMSGAGSGGGRVLGAGGKHARQAAPEGTYDLPTVDIDSETGRMRIIWP